MIPSFDYKPNQNRVEKLNKDENAFEEYHFFLTRLLDRYFNQEIYQYFNSKINCLALAEQIKDFFKKFSQRYRIIVQISIGQHLDQTILITSRSLWDKSHDTFLQKQYLKGTFFALIIVFFIYKE